MARALLHTFGFGFGVWIGGIDQKSGKACSGKKLAQQFEAFYRQHGLQGGDTRHISARPVQAGHQTELDWVYPDKENNGDRCGGRLGRKGRRGAANRGDHRHLTAHKVSRQRRQLIVLPQREAVFERDVFSLDKARLLQALAERGQGNSVGRRFDGEIADNRDRTLLLRTRRERPCGHAAEQRDEVAPLHSITSSAAASNLSGTTRPSILAVWALMTSSNLLACTTGRSDGFAPLRMRPV